MALNGLNMQELGSDLLCVFKLFFVESILGLIPVGKSIKNQIYAQIIG